MQPKHDVFIACSALNESFGEQLQNGLQKSGLQTHLSLDNSAGQINDQEALTHSRLMLLVASSPSLNSVMIQAEIEVATQAGLPIIAAQIGNLKERPASLGGAVWVDEFNNQSQENLAAIVAATRAQLDVITAQMPESKRGTDNGRALDVFISHSSKDKAQANLLWKALEKRGHKCWIAPESIKPGEDWPTAIENGVETCAVLALLFNGNSDESGEVRTELAFAKEYGKSIVSIRLEAVPPRYKLKYFIWDKQWISADAKPFDQEVERVADEIEKLLDFPRPAIAAAMPAPDDDQNALQNIVAKVRGAARFPRLPRRAAAPDGPTIAIAMSFRGVRQGRIFNAIRDGATDLEATDKRGRTALHYAAEAAELEIIIALLESGAKVNAADAEGLTPLHLSVANSDVARLLLMNGADIAAQTATGWTPLDYAVLEKKAETKSLMNLWSDIKRGHQTANDALRASFTASARYRARDIIDAIAAGADDLTLTDSKGRNALHWAAREAELELVEHLLEAGADPKTPDADGKTPAMLARASGKSGSEEVVALLNDWEQK